MKKLLLLGSLLGGALWLWNKAQPPRGIAYLHGRVVVITGASSGIGAAAAKAFAAQGAKLVIAARRTEHLDALKQEIEATYDAPVTVVTADVSRDEDAARIVQAALDAYGRIDVLVNNAGVAPMGRLEAMSEAALRQLINVNFYGAINLTRRVIPVMQAQAPDRSGLRGHIVMTASVAANAVLPGQSLYGATKAGLLQFNTVAQQEYKARGIHFSTVLPGITLTHMVGTEDPSTFRQLLKEAGMDYPGLSLDTPAYVAGKIVNAVRYDQRRVITGGPTMGLLVQLSRRTPKLYELISHIVDPDAAIRAQEKVEQMRQ